MPRPRLLFLVSEDWYFVSHRAHLAAAAQAEGFEVLVACRVGRHGQCIEAAGHRLLPITVPRGGSAPWRDMQSVRRLVALYREHQPDIVHHVALKNMLLGTLAANFARVPAVVNALTGFGHLSDVGGVKGKLGRRVVQGLFRCLRSTIPSRLIVQNAEDRDEMIATGAALPHQVALIRGAGVCTATFQPGPIPAGPPIVMLAARMLWSKGIGEFVAAAQSLKAGGCQARFVLVGRVDAENPLHIPRAQLVQWCDQGAIEWWDQSDKMPEILTQATMVCLPSYAEGLPKVLLEAAACGKPLVATDVRGCREVCREGVSGLLVPAKESAPLAAAISQLLANSEQRQRMGVASRQIAVEEFASAYIARQTLDVYRDVLATVASRKSLRRAAA